MRLSINKEIKSEIVHYYDSRSKDMIASTGNHFKITLNKEEFNVKVPNKSILINFRILRRLLRLDKSNAFFNYSKTGVVIIYSSRIYFFDLNSKHLKFINQLKQCRCVLHNSISVTQDGIYFGEYGRNTSRQGVPIWSSHDDGKSFSIIHEVPQGKIKHIHGIYDDPYSSSLWITTGDKTGECFLIEAIDHNFKDLKWYGDGSQSWRTVSIFFTEDKIIWIMDSPNILPTLQIFDRELKTISSGQSFDAPVWYIKRLDAGGALIQTSIEPGKAVTTNNSKIFYSNNFLDWTEVHRFKKDILPKILFKFGVISFSDGYQDLNRFIISGEALKGLDGTSFECSIN